jgi:hypothetical protein
MTTEQKQRTSRIYRVQSEGEPARLVRATQVRIAAQHVALQGLEIRVATQDDIVSGLGAGVPIEYARGTQAPN